MKPAVEKYIPPASKDYVESIMNKYAIDLKIVNQRRTKHGDFRKLPNGKMMITVNNNLNEHQFLMTLIHEIAHYITFTEYGRVQPHGQQWKKVFRKLMLPLLRPEIFPNKILGPLANHLKNPKASTDSDPKLSLVLQDGKAKEGAVFIHSLNEGDHFFYRNQGFQRGKLRRTRIECLNLENNKLYLFHQNAEVEIPK